MNREVKKNNKGTLKRIQKKGIKGIVGEDSW
jgi:hypothetical protein